MTGRDEDQKRFRNIFSGCVHQKFKVICPIVISVELIYWSYLFNHTVVRDKHGSSLLPNCMCRRF